jgi:hypothetical protein
MDREYTKEQALMLTERSFKAFVVAVIVGCLAGCSPSTDQALLDEYNALAEGHDVPMLKDTWHIIGEGRNSIVVGEYDIKRAIRWNRFAISRHLGCMTADDAARLTDEQVDGIMLQVRAGVLPRSPLVVEE